MPSVVGFWQLPSEEVFLHYLTPCGLVELLLDNQWVADTTVELK